MKRWSVTLRHPDSGTRDIFEFELPDDSHMGNAFTAAHAEALVRYPATTPYEWISVLATDYGPVSPPEPAPPPAPPPEPAPPPAPQPEATLREIWVLIGRIEERTRCGRVVASWKRYVATHQPEAFDTQAILSKVALEVLCSTGEPDET